MTLEDFWQIVERVHAAVPTNMPEKCRLLGDELRRLPPEEIKSFGGHFSDLFYQAYDWEIWAAAYIIRGGGCSDDSFMDFRSTLISLGHAAYETALRNVDALTDFNIDPSWATYEGYQYVPSKVYEEKCGSRPAVIDEGTAKEKKHPKEPTGRDWNDWDLHERYPRLAAKYEWNKRDWTVEKQKHQKQINDGEKGLGLAQLMIDAGIIPACGLIPPPRIAAQVLRIGQVPGSGKTWEPMELDETHFWIAVRCFHQASQLTLQNRPDLKGLKITMDTNALGASTYDEWLTSLKQRGLI